MITRTLVRLTKKEIIEALVDYVNDRNNFELAANDIEDIVWPNYDENVDTVEIIFKEDSAS